MWMGDVKGKAQTSIVIVASCDGYSLDGYKIAIQRCVGSRDTWMKEVAGLKDGMTSIPALFLKEMFETSGQKVTEVNKEIGDER